jgi:hypothetical protein
MRPTFQTTIKIPTVEEELVRILYGSTDPTIQMLCEDWVKEARGKKQYELMELWSPFRDRIIKILEVKWNVHVE